MKFLKVIFSFLSVLVLSSCMSDSDPGIEQYYPNRDAGIAFLEANKSNDGVVVTETGLQYEVLVEGEGDYLNELDIIKMKYKSTLIDDSVLYSNQGLDDELVGYSQISALLPGLTEGLQYMQLGGRYKLYIPYELAYGESLEFGFIDPFSVIIMEVEPLENSFIQIKNSGLRYDVIEEGVGEKPVADSRVKVHYEGSFLNGVVFDSSIERGEPFEFEVNPSVIQGWVEGVQLMNEGAKYRFFMPPSLAYGSTGNGLIPPNTPLIFEIELIEVLE